MFLANFPDEVVADLPAEFECGVYYGWASVDNGEVHEMCMSVGWNPFYQNTKRTMVRLNEYFVDGFQICSLLSRINNIKVSRT